MSINTLHKVTLTEGQIGVILCSLEDSVKKSEHYREDRVKGQSLQPFDDYVNEVDSIFEILEGSVDKYYDKVEKAQSQQPVGEWQDTYISVTHIVDLLSISIIIRTYTTKDMENYLNLFEHIPEDEHNHISNKIWEALDRAGIKLNQDAELSIRIYDDEYEGDFDGQEYDS